MILDPSLWGTYAGTFADWEEEGVTKPYYKTPDGKVTLLHGHVLDVLREMPAESVNCVVTSPPYWSLRDYDCEPVIWGGDPNCPHTLEAQPVGGESYEGKARWQHDGVSRQETPEAWVKAQTKGQSGGDGSSSGLNCKRDDDGKFASDSHAHGTDKLYGAIETATCRLCGAWRGQYGLEPTPELYVEHTMMWLREVRRVLRKDGTLWLNLGDGYASGSSGHAGESQLDGGEPTGSRSLGRVKPPGNGLKAKDAILMPFRVALAAQADGWWVRSVIIWHKNNPMPESVKDRPTDAHEYIFLLTKSKTYWYDADAVREGLAESTLADSRNNTGRHTQDSDKYQHDVAGAPDEPSWYRGKTFVNPVAGRNMRSVWTFPTQGFSGAKLLADYVGHDGKPYKLSADCPVHGHLVRSRRLDKGQDGGRPGPLPTRSPDSDDCPVPMLFAEEQATIAHSSSGESNGNAQTQTLQSIPDRRNYAALRDTNGCDESSPRTNRTSEQDGSPVHSSDSPALGCADSATPHSSGSHRTAPVPATSLSYTPCEETAGRTGRTSALPMFDAHHLDIAVNSISPDDRGAHSPGQTQGRTAGKSSRSHSTCTCTIVSIDHFAVFPRELPERCIKAGCPEWVCSKCGKARVRMTENTPMKIRRTDWGELAGNRTATSGTMVAPAESTTTGWTDCGCGEPFVGGVTLDPFAGSGTTCEVAYHLGRTAWGIDASAKYLDMAIERVKQGVLL